MAVLKCFCTHVRVCFYVCVCTCMCKCVYMNIYIICIYACILYVPTCTYTYTCLNIFTCVYLQNEHIRLPAKLLDYFLQSNKSNINQSTVHETHNSWYRTQSCRGFFGPRSGSTRVPFAQQYRYWPLNDLSIRNSYVRIVYVYYLCCWAKGARVEPERGPKIVS